VSTDRGAVQRVGIIGIGEMGTPMVERMLAAGYEVGFYARRPDAGLALEQHGARRVPSARTLAEDSDVVIVCVFTDEQVAGVCLGHDGVLAHMRPGAVLINHTTGSPDTAMELDAAASSRGVHFLDAALSGAPAQISVGDLTLLIGGDEAVLAGVLPVLASICAPGITTAAHGAAR